MFSQLSKDIQSGNLSAAQQDYKTIQQAMQSQAAHGRHHHNGGSTSGTSEIGEALDQLGTALQSGNLSSAQGTFTTLQQDLQQLNQNSGQAASPSSPRSTIISIDV
jgi:hypothetical protein